MSKPETMTFDAADIYAVQEANDSIQSVGTLLLWAGRAIEQRVADPNPVSFSALGSAIRWAGEELGRQGQLIAERV